MSNRTECIYRQYKIAFCKIVWSLLDKRAFMAESQTFYRAFGPAMEVLQHKG